MIGMRGHHVMEVYDELEICDGVRGGPGRPRDRVSERLNLN